MQVHLDVGVHSGQVVTFAAARMPTSEVQAPAPGQGRNSDRDVSSMCTPAPSLGPQHRVPEPVLSLETGLKSE